MERLTDRFDDKTTIGVINVFANDDLIDIPEYIKGPIVTASICNAIEKLAEYEDTGLEPEEIKELQDQVEVLTDTVNMLSPLMMEIYKLRQDCDYWKREALKWCNEIGEQRIGPLIWMDEERIKNERSK